MSILEKTRPGRHIQPISDDFQTTPVIHSTSYRAKRNGPIRFGCGFLFVLALVYFLGPLRTNFLILGVDDSLDRGDLGRTDTIILTTIVPFWPYVGLLGIPRDLWVEIPSVGEQRINTAYFFAEASQAGTGGSAAVGAVRQNFGVKLHYYIILHMSGLVDFVDALGGIDISLDAPLGGLPAGSHHLNGAQALAFVRERYSSDDFSRMQQGQVLIMAAVRAASRPANWKDVPAAFFALSQVVETNIPTWQWPRLGFAFLRSILFGVDMQTISREMVTPLQTSGGAQVLTPNWDRINPLLEKMFGQ